MVPRELAMNRVPADAHAAESFMNASQGVAAWNADSVLMTPIQALTTGFKFTPVSEDAAPEEAASQASGSSAYNNAARGSASQLRQGFRVGNLRLMIRYEEGSELLEMPDVYRLPNAPEWFIGMVNLHGVLTPVFDLSPYLGVEHDPQSKRMLLVLSQGAGVLIDGLPERLRWTSDERTEAGTAPRLLAPHVQSACLIGQQLYFDLDCASLLNTFEQAIEPPG